MFRAGSSAISLRFGVVGSLVAVLLLIGMSAPATAQIADAVIEVIAQDESQAVLPGVTVTVLRPDTGYTQSSVTDPTGTARFIALQPGTYNVNPADPQNTGLGLAIDATRLDNTFVNPYATQATAGYTARLGRTGLFADFEGIYVKGKDEIVLQDQNWAGNGVAGGRPDKTRNFIDTYTNKGRSEYKAFVMSLNGVISGGHLFNASFTIADKKNIEDDFSPALTDYPNDPANLEAEWGRSRGDERYRFVVSGVVKLPARFTLAPIFSNGSGQPWNHRLGYDANGDGRNSDRPSGTPRFSENGPNFMSFDMRLTYKLPLGSRSNVDLIAQAFNLFNRVNYDVNFLQNNEYLGGPTPTAPAAALVPNPNFKTYTATLPSREIQLGVRWTF